MRLTTSPITQIHTLFMVLVLTASANAAVRTLQGQTPQPDADTRAKAAYEQGRKLADSQQFEAAIENFRTAIRLKPDDMLAREWLGLAYVFSRRYEEAIQTYNKLLELKPDYANAYGNLGYVYILLGKYEKAVAVSKEGIAMNPAYGPAYENLGVATSELGRNEDAVSAFNAALKLNSNQTRNRDCAGSPVTLHQPRPGLHRYAAL